ncbi:hypothetical protein AB0M46_07790 [Dactylosporangium sp. NPDC051485]|uniref:hypothetical protein n=1 Tax=Dactylosporangium sp. NPDC051485 TaxID=3154846 RepID=UPI00344AC76B
MAGPQLLPRTDLEHVDAGGVIDRLLADLRGGRRLAGGVPYRHVNGFTKIVAARYDDGSRLTLHYWPASRTAAQHVSRPHDHRFPFSSILLGGRQYFVELDEDPAGEPWQRFTYRPYLGGTLAHIAACGWIGLTQVRTVERAPLHGQYVTTSAIVHRAVTDRREACATLVMRGPREKVRSQVYYRPDEPPPRGGVQLGRRLARAEVTRQLQDIAAMIS